MTQTFAKYVIAWATIVFLALAASGWAQDDDTMAKSDSKSTTPMKALIIDGQNNHGAWPATTVMMKSYLEESGRFTVDVARTQFTWRGGELVKQHALTDGKKYEDLPKPKPDPDFKPDFSKYDVVVSNFGFNAAPWPEETQKGLVKFVKEGGGFVVVHAADNSFGDWKEFNQIIGVGGWGGRTEKNGPYVYYGDDEKLVRDEKAGKGGGHGPQHEYQIVSRDNDHPIMRGLPTSWLHAKDELYDKLRGPAENMKVLATAFSAKKFRGTERHEPMIMTVDYGKGRCFHTPMGHAIYSMECVGYKTVFVRGTEWAATGKVTLTEVPKDFPTRDKSSSQKFKFEKTKAAAK